MTKVRSMNQTTLCQRTAADNILSDDRTVIRSDGQPVVRENYDGRDLLLWRAVGDTSYEMYRIAPNGDVSKV